MDTCLPESPEKHSRTSDSVHFRQTLDDWGHSSTAPLESNLENGPSTDNLSPWSEETIGDRSDCEPKEDNDLLHLSPTNSFSAYSYSPSAKPWSSVKNSNPLVGHRSEPALVEDTTSALNSPPLLYSAGETKPSDSGWPVAGRTTGETKSASGWGVWPLQQYAETKLSISVSPAQLDDEKPYLVGAGLANLGNTCFLNSVLQCLTHTVLLVQGLRSCNHSMPCSRHNEGFCALCALRGQIELSLTHTGNTVSPLKLVENLSYFSPSFQRFQQEDAHEFLQCFLDRLDCCFSDSKTKDTTLSSQNDNFVKNVFGGCLISKLRCCNCNHCSDTFEPVIDLSLEIEDVGTLPAALESFTKVEKIEDQEMRFTCEKCKELVSVEKQLMLDRAPAVAALHLKRFKNDGSFVEKIDKYVEFPLEMDLLPYTSSNQNSDVELKYGLYAVVVHIEFSSSSGHYYCFIRSSPGTWYKFDDSKVVRVQEEFVLSQKAYILFYAKQGTPWFSSFMESEKSSIDPNIFNTSPKSVLDDVDHVCKSSPIEANAESCDANETSNILEKIYMGFPNGSRDLGQDEVEVSEAKYDSCRMHSPKQLGASNSFARSSSKVVSPSALKESDSNLEFPEVRVDANMPPQTPPRSPSPDIYIEEPPERSYSIPRDHVNLAGQSCKRQLNKLTDGYEIKEACRTLKSMPGSRSKHFLAAMGIRGSHSEGFANKKSRRMEFSPDINDKCSSGHHRKPHLNSVARSLAAGSFR